MPAVWTIADLHLSFGTPNKKMDVFGERWVNHEERVKEHWQQLVHLDDLVLIPGDISWGMTPEQALPDLEWIHQLPGTKVMIKGNHDYWWTSLKKLEKILPPSIHLIQNNAFVWNNIAIAGTRLWDDVNLSFDGYIEMKDNPLVKTLVEAPLNEETVKIYNRELMRLENSLKAIPKHCEERIAMTHYPPVGPLLQPSAASSLLEKYGVELCTFGHLHCLKRESPLFGKLNGIEYVFAACDYLDSTPVCVKQL
jgi:predicted phosphohydrolase